MPLVLLLLVILVLLLLAGGLTLWLLRHRRTVAGKPSGGLVLPSARWPARPMPGHASRGTPLIQSRMQARKPCCPTLMCRPAMGSRMADRPTRDRAPCPMR